MARKVNNDWYELVSGFYDTEFEAIKEINKNNPKNKLSALKKLDAAIKSAKTDKQNFDNNKKIKYHTPKKLVNPPKKAAAP